MNPTTDTEQTFDIHPYIMYVIEPANADLNKRLMDKSYWGDSGEWVDEALQEIKSILFEYPLINTKSEVVIWLNRSLVQLENARDMFREKRSDPDGYGSGTFKECIDRLRDVRKEILSKPSF
ncbi:hypothetical protein [Sulfuricurvum sp.]|uniref:hypothetical protein n=1 Tax=Sulfuricurvum sp. TaxID=2025608 RepID=UPI003BB4A36A